METRSTWLRTICATISPIAQSKALLLLVAALVSIVSCSRRKKEPEPIFLKFIDDSVGESVSRHLVIDSVFDESELTALPLGWTAYSFHYSHEQLDYVGHVLQPTNKNHGFWGNADFANPCGWQYLPKDQQPSIGESLAFGNFIGPNGTGVVTMLDENNHRGWVCILRGDRAPREDSD